MERLLGRYLEHIIILDKKTINGTVDVILFNDIFFG